MTSGGQAQKEKQSETLTWVSHPARENPGLLAFVILIILAFSLTILWADGDLLLALTSAVILVLSTLSFFLPTRVTLSSKGVVVAMPGFRRRRTWASLRRWEKDRAGVLLSPFLRPHPVLDWRRGLFLRGGERLSIYAFVEKHLGPAYIHPPKNGSVSEGELLG